MQQATQLPYIIVNNNNNIVFFVPTELGQTRGETQKTKISRVTHVDTYSEISQSLNSLLTDSSQVSLGLPLPLFLSTHFRTPLCTGASGRPPLDMSKPSQSMLGKFLLNWCHPYSFPNNFISDSIPPCVPAKPPQHPHLCYTQLLDMSSFYRPTFSTV